MAFWTGARPNELAALKWGDVDWAHGSLRVRVGRYRGVESTPKTASSIRDIDLLPRVVDALRAEKAQQAAQRLKRGQGVPEVGQDYAFTGPQGGFLNPNWLRDRVWYPALTKAGLRRRTFYQTRHTFASNALAAGEAPAWVAQMLGHATPEMLFTVYARFIPNRTRRDGSALAERMTTPGLLSNSKPAAGHEGGGHEDIGLATAAGGFDHKPLGLPHKAAAAAVGVHNRLTLSRDIARPRTQAFQQAKQERGAESQQTAEKRASGHRLIAEPVRDHHLRPSRRTSR